MSAFAWLAALLACPPAGDSRPASPGIPAKAPPPPAMTRSHHCSPFTVGAGPEAPMAGVRQHRGPGSGQLCPDFQVYAASHTLGISERCSVHLGHQNQGWSTRGAHPEGPEPRVPSPPPPPLRRGLRIDTGSHHGPQPTGHIPGALGLTPVPVGTPGSTPTPGNRAPVRAKVVWQ